MADEEGGETTDVLGLGRAATFERPCYWLAPMVGQSEPAFRMFTRKFGVTLATTPMIDAAGYVKSEKYRAEFPFFPEDRPLVVQFGGCDPKILAAASSLVAPFCDAIELNCGCPQRCAKQGGYGAFLMEDEPLLETLVKSMVAASNVPIYVKIRVFDDVERTVQLALMIERAGATVLTVHGRTRQQGGGRHQGEAGANWETIAAVKAALRIPVVSNGNIRTFADVQRCLDETQCDGVMSGCGILVHPRLFEKPALGEDAIVPEPSAALAREYVEYAVKYMATHQQITKHLVAYLGPALRRHADIRDRLLTFRGAAGDAEAAQTLNEALRILEGRLSADPAPSAGGTSPGAAALPNGVSDAEDFPAPKRQRGSPEGI